MGWGEYVAGIPGYQMVGRARKDPRDIGISIIGEGFIRNAASTTSPHSVWNVGGSYPWDAQGTVATVVSDNAADTDGGSGCNTLIIQGVDMDLNEQVEVITMNGTTPVNGSIVWRSIFASACLAGGAFGDNEGDISVAVDGQEVSRCEAGTGRSFQSNFIVPADWRNGAFIGQLLLSVGERGSTVVAFELKAKANHNDASTWNTIFPLQVHSYGGLTRIEPDTPATLTPGVAIDLVSVGTTRNNASVFCAYEMMRP